MSKRRWRRPNFFLIAILIILILAAVLANIFVVPKIPPMFSPTPTPTSDPLAFLQKAQNEVREGRIAQGVETYKEVIKLIPDQPGIYVELARLQVFLGEYDQAVKNAQNALLLNPDNSHAHAVQGWALSYLDKHVDAEAEIRKALDIDPDNALAHAYYAELLVGLERFEELEKAGQESRLALQLAPDSFEAHRARGIVLYNTQNLPEAVEAFKQAISINRYIADTHLYLGITYKAMEEYELAEDALLVAYSLNPHNAIALTELSRTYFADGRYGQAEQYAEEAVNLEPQNPRLHGNLGIILYKSEKYVRAINSLELVVRGGVTEDGTAVEGLPLVYGRVMEYYWYYGFALAKNNRCGDAIPVFQALLTGVPENEIAVYNAEFGLSLCLESNEPTSIP